MLQYPSFASVAQWIEQSRPKGKMQVRFLLEALNVCYNSSMQPDNSTQELKYLIEKNTEILKENNRILKKIYRNELIGIWVRVVWFVLLIGLPFALYFYILEPYFTAMGSSYDVFSAGMQEIPGWKQFQETLTAVKESRSN